MQLLLLAIALLCGQGQLHEDEVPVTTYNYKPDKRWSARYFN